MKLAIGIFCLCTAWPTYSSELVKACKTGPHPAETIEVVRDSKIASTYVYYLRQNGKLTPFFGTPEQSRGESVLAACIGRITRALVVSGEFTANARQGFVITSNSGRGTLERMDFAEKSPPQWLYLSAREIIVLLPTSGYGETNAAYIAYHGARGKSGADRVEAINRLPFRNGFSTYLLPLAASILPVAE